jgi:diguanylate cyclase (GGDEF)-like protein
LADGQGYGCGLVWVWAERFDEALGMERIELLEAVLDSLPDAVAVMGHAGEAVYWNRAAEALTGFAAIDVVGRPALEALVPLLGETAASEADQNAGHWAHLHLSHKLGHEVQAISLHLVLRDGLGGRIGRAILFHPAHSLDALPHGDAGDSESVASSQEDLEQRLEQAFEEFQHGGSSFGVVWISVDQAYQLRKTHGIAACETMLAKVQHSLAQGMRPAEVLGRWGVDEFLAIAHERTVDMLGAHAKTLAGLARTADFRWWGDRVQLTVSIGACQATRGGTETLAQLLKQAQNAMEASIRAGGNTITPEPGGKTCLPS